MGSSVLRYHEIQFELLVSFGLSLKVEHQLMEFTITDASSVLHLLNDENSLLTF